MQLFKNASKAFTLIELVLVISVGLTMSFLAFQKMISEHENTQAKSAGQQIKKIGESVNSYIVNHYDKLSTLSNSNGTAIDQGPRTCVTTTNTCSITIQTLINDGLLPTTYSGKNIYNSSYTINLKRTGTSPYYTISGLVLTTDSWLDTSTTIRYDLVGKAMQEAGIDSGTTRDSTSVVNGYNGNWHVDNTDFPSVNKKGLLAYQVGFGSNSYSVFLRRDGTLPMTGNLNMGNQDITNAKNITASGVIQTKTLNTTEAAVIGTNLNVAGISTLNGATTVGSTLSVFSNISSGGDIFAQRGVSSNGNIYSLQMVGAGLPGNATTPPVPLSYLNSNGEIYAAKTITSDGSISAKGDINAGNWLTAKNGLGNMLKIGGDATGDYDFVFQPSSNGNNVVGFFSNTTTTLDFSFRGNISALNTAGNLRGVSLDGNNGNIVASGNITGKYIIPTNVLTVGSACSPNGLISRTADGSPISCINGVMAKQKYTFTTYGVLFQTTSAGTGDQWQTKDLGSHLFCFLTGLQNSSSIHYPVAKHVTVTPTPTPTGYNWVLSQRVTQWGSEIGYGFDTWAYATCAD